LIYLKREEEREKETIEKFDLVSLIDSLTNLASIFHGKNPIKLYELYHKIERKSKHSIFCKI